MKGGRYGYGRGCDGSVFGCDSHCTVKLSRPRISPRSNLRHLKDAHRLVVFWIPRVLFFFTGAGILLTKEFKPIN